MKTELLKEIQEELELNALTILELSDILQGFGCEAVAEFGNIEDIIDTGNVVVAIDGCGDERIIIEFDVEYRAGTGHESILSSVIIIASVEEF